MNQEELIASELRYRVDPNGREECRQCGKTEWRYAYSVEGESSWDCPGCEAAEGIVWAFWMLQDVLDYGKVDTGHGGHTGSFVGDDRVLKLIRAYSDASGVTLGEANDDIPEDEMTLAEVIAFAESNGYGYISGAFTTGGQKRCFCAVGILSMMVTGYAEPHLGATLKGIEISSSVYYGSDTNTPSLSASKFGSSFDFGNAWRAYWNDEG